MPRTWLNLIALGLLALALGCAGVSVGSTVTPGDDQPAALQQYLQQELARELAQRDDRSAAAAWLMYADPRERALELAYDPVSGVLSWNYNNLGDNNLDGVVDMSDVAPIGMCYGHYTNDGLGDDGWEAWIDRANDDWYVNIIDVSYVGQYYERAVVEYAIYTAAVKQLDGSEALHEQARLALSARLPGWPPRFACTVPDNGERYILLREVGLDGAAGRDYWWDRADPDANHEPYKYHGPGSDSYVYPSRLLVALRVEVDSWRAVHFIAQEQLEVAATWPEVRGIGVYLPPGGSIEDAIANWPREYPETVESVQPEYFYTLD